MGTDELRIPETVLKMRRIGEKPSAAYLTLYARDDNILLLKTIMAMNGRSTAIPDAQRNAAYGGSDVAYRRPEMRPGATGEEMPLRFCRVKAGSGRTAAE